MPATQLPQLYMPIVNDKTNPLPCIPTFIKWPPTLHKKENPYIVFPRLFIPHIPPSATLT